MRNKIEEIFYSTDDCKEIVDEDTEAYKKVEKTRCKFLDRLPYDADDVYKAYLNAIKELYKDKESIYYERGFIRGAKTMMCILQKEENK